MLKIPTDKLSPELLKSEIAVIFKLGAEYKQAEIGKDINISELAKTYDAVLLAAGDTEYSIMESWGIFNGEGSTKPFFDKSNYHLTGNPDLPNVFAAGSTIQSGHMAVRAVGMAHRAAISIMNLLSGKAISSITQPFNTRIGKVNSEELERMVQLRDSLSDSGKKVEHETPQASDCLHCNCRAVDSCLLRKYSDQLDASPVAYKNAVRKEYAVENSLKAGLVYESGKCIKCGLCIQVSKSNPAQALTFTGRGYNTRVVTPAGLEFDDLPAEMIHAIIDICPTGAMSGR